MMKRKISIISIFLCVVLCISSFVACGKVNDGSEETAIKETRFSLVEGGSTEYKIVIPDDANERMIFSQNELVSLFKTATRISLGIVKESDVTYSDEAKLIVLGDCSDLHREAGITVDYAELGLNGFVLKTIGSNLFVAGGQQYGTLNGIYEFLRYNFDFEVYAKDELQIMTDVTDLKLLDFDVKKVPDIQQQMANYGFLRHDKSLALRMGTELWDEIWVSPSNSGEWVHNFLVYCDPDKYCNPSDPENYHPEWFCKNADGTCLGDPSKTCQRVLCLSQQGVLDVIVEGVKQALIDSPTLSNISITQMDHAQWCKCSECTADFEKYGTNAGNLIKFINKVSRAVTPWLEENFPGRQVKFTTFSYQDVTRKAPVVYDSATDTYSPIDQDVVCDDNVAILICTDNLQSAKSPYDESQSAVLDNIRAWQILTKTIDFWSYEINYKHTFLPFNTFNEMQGLYRMYKESGAQVVLNQGETRLDNMSGFIHLKIYLQSKLRWDVNADLTKYTQEFFDNYYCEASEKVMEAFNALRLHFDWMENVKGYIPGLYDDFSDEYAKNWPYGTLKNILSILDEAIDSIEYLKSADNVKYETICKRIRLEKLCYEYLLIEFYPEKFTDDELLSAKLSFQEEAKEQKVTYIGEGVLLESLWVRWGIPA